MKLNKFFVLIASFLLIAIPAQAGIGGFVSGLTATNAVNLSTATGILGTANGGTGSSTLGNITVGFASVSNASLVADAVGDTTTFPLLAGDSSGNKPLLTDADLTYDATANIMQIAGSTVQTAATTAQTKIKTLGFSTGAAATGQQGSYAIAPCAGTITSWDIVANAGTATFQVWKIATGTAAPTVSNSINTSGVALATGTAIHSTTLSDFTTTTIAANDIIAFNVSATSGATQLYGDIQITCTN